MNLELNMEDLLWLAGGGTLEQPVIPDGPGPPPQPVRICLKKSLARDRTAFRNAGVWGDCPPFQVDRPELQPKPLGKPCADMDDGKHCCEQCEEWKHITDMSPIETEICQDCWQDQEHA